MGKWVKDRLDSFCHIEMGQSPDSSGYNSEGVGLPLIQGNADIENRKTIKRNFTSIITKTAFPGEIILTVRAPVGNVAVATDECCLGRGVCAISNSNVDKHFLYHALIWRESEWQKLEQGSTFTAVGHKEVESFSIEYPVLENEQRHIAEILTACDEVIEKSEAVVDKYRAIKAGMLNDLFTRGIGKNGKLRPPPESAPQLYKDTVLGKVPREWEVKTIVEIGDVVTGSTPSRSDNANWGGDFNWISAQDFQDKYIYNAAEKVTDKGKNACRLLPLNSVLVTCIASIGLNAIAKVECATNQQINAVICDGCDYEYFYYLICFNDGKLKRLAGQTAVPIIGKTDFQQLQMAYPSDIAEQQQIAEQLSAIDVKIADELAVVAKYRKVKAGLMARLLTPPDMEVE